MKILQVSYRVPFPPNDGGTIGIFNITKGLSDAGLNVHTFSINTPKHFQPKDALKSISVQHDIFVDTAISPFNLLVNFFFSSKPYNVMRFVNKKVEMALSSLLKSEEFDLIHVEGTFMAHYIDIIRKFSSSPVVIRAHNIEYTIWERLAENENNFFKKLYYKSLAKRIKNFESIYYNLFDAVAAITLEDKNRLLKIGIKTRIEVIPAGVIVEKFAKISIKESFENSVFVLSALDWIPNQEALLWFVEHVWPLVTKDNKEVELHIAGKNTPELVYNLKNEKIIVHGFVDDASIFMQTYNLMLVPLLSGGGMRVKIIEGMAAGKCILASEVGAEGISYTNYENIVICKNPKDWAKNILAFLGNSKNRELISENAKKLVDIEYDNRTVTKKYLSLYHSLLVKK